MQHRWKISTILFLVAMCLGGVAIYVVCETVGPQISRGAKINSAGYLALAGSILGTLGFSVAGVITSLIHRTATPTPDANGVAAVSLDELPLYAKIYNSTSDPSVKLAIRATAKLANDSQFERWFPVGAEGGK